jgi:hypothetical protein
VKIKLGTMRSPAFHLTIYDLRCTFVAVALVVVAQAVSDEHDQPSKSDNVRM